MINNSVSGPGLSVNDIPVDFKSTLPPRKRAKTKEEKEQRRIERILRNRRAAHQSREKKRLHLQHLERKAALLEQILSSKSVAQLVHSDRNLSTIYDEYQSLALAAADVDEMPVSEAHGSPESATGGHRTPESLPERSASLSASFPALASNQLKLTPQSNSSASSPAPSLAPDVCLKQEMEPHLVVADPLADSFEESSAPAEVTFDSSSILMSPNGVISTENDAGFELCNDLDVSNWNLLLTNDHDEYPPHSYDEDEYPVLDKTDNSWGLDSLRNPAVIKLLMRA
ncbi:LANO_0D10198g1_1 [Lachancea nothofagi CBS 11611]|uniref:LANO_0D10198g1_1 n=1 Tax=Lachancea nothofagi CBS 11611 TaxID=1266666 RepID=A0A1G4JKJ0_9SACH|nr:LANO_0D10198g1_1 [Lachancea nothofagi CBS 11611]